MNSDIRNFLRARFNSSAAAGLDVRVGFAWHGDDASQCRFRITDERIDDMEDIDEPKLDLTLFFASSDLLRAVVLGEANPIEHFMQGEFRADGGLPLVFPLLSSFTGQPNARAPQTRQSASAK
ncbi:MAG: hypothetical protein OXE81_04960 [Gammaproteobacteria bacterium]|nr:hypothetical protein [Gammaproteobacteria bacterium]